MAGTDHVPHPDQHQRRKVLILGEAGVSDLIGAALEAEDFEIELEYRLKDRFPQAVGTHVTDSLKAAMKAFVDRSDSESLYIHPGVAAWADRAELPTVAQELGVNAITPPSRALTLFSNKLNLFGEAERLGVSNLLQHGEPVHGLREIQKFIEKSGQRLPFVLKAVRGGGGFGRYVVRDSLDLGPKLGLWIEQLRRNSGEVMLMIERYVEGARYVVVPFARLIDGHFEAFPLVDASLQSRFRKIVEFCPCAGIDDPVRSRILSWAQALAEGSGYVGVGSMEFMVDGTRVYLVEALARLDTNFHLWERVAGTRAVRWQLAALEGATADSASLPLRAASPEWQVGLSLRLYAEDSVLQLPQPGTVYEVSECESWEFPGAQAERLLSIAAGSVIGHDQSGLLGFLWVGASDRAQAIVVARGVLDELWIAGTLQTNERFLSELLVHPWVRAGHFHAGFVDEEFLPPMRPSPEILSILVQLCEACPLDEVAPPKADGAPSYRWAVGDQWVRDPGGLAPWTAPPKFYNLPCGAGVSGTLKLSDGRAYRAAAFPLGADRWQARVGAWSMTVRRAAKRPVGGAKAASAAPRILALVPGRVHSILFRKGAVIPAHEVYLIIESLGMLVPHAIPKAAKVRKWHVAAEDLVSAGQELADFEIL